MPLSFHLHHGSDHNTSSLLGTKPAVKSPRAASEATVPFKTTAVAQWNQVPGSGQERGLYNPSLGRCQKQLGPSASPFVICGGDRSSGLQGSGQARAIFCKCFYSDWGNPWKVREQTKSTQSKAAIIDPAQPKYEPLNGILRKRLPQAEPSGVWTPLENSLKN